ncbi:FAD dependent oxidoreductase [Pseudovirgaria hyperparasitica]|uniref:FAD dependent oxidoreductase n=1 Tax=Pseudovirgaria hyperparasitica TaxID=470096 RepID=A0A6A6VZE2_9PEZI|nr:FAD dependent oxidoreductase [Pseudovirgaria hyperparasitica]KAF2755683.1 FAD dependent oxidoreductase [Pseudovirgaria hyperparasitica]
MSESKQNIVIIGGGIIGCTSAYFLSSHPSFDPSKHSITLLEPTAIAGGASGKAGGLLALWAYPSCIVPLSYRLHKELAEKHNGKDRWGYRGVHCGQVEFDTKSTSKRKETKESEDLSLQKRDTESRRTLRRKGVPGELDWIHADILRAYDEMGTPDTTAQVHPYQFTTSMAALAQESGVKIVYGAATHINKDSSDAVESVTYTSKDDKNEYKIPASIAILAAGPWTHTILPSVPISAMRAHSVTIRPSRPVSAFCLFTQIRGGMMATPEIYARPNNEVYACGEGDEDVALPTTSDLVHINDERCMEIVKQVGSISDELRCGETLVKQACYLPNVRGGGGPLIGETGTKGLLIAAGHTCWGIQNAPATGMLISEIVWEGKAKSAHIESLDPRKFMT